MKVLKKFEFPVSTFGESKHDWPAILAAKVERGNLGKPGPAVCLIHGDDFTNDADQFIGTIRNQAAKRHLKSKVSKVAEEGKPVTLYVQVCDMNDEEIANADARVERQKESGKKRLEAKKNAPPATAGTIPPTAAVG